MKFKSSSYFLMALMLILVIVISLGLTMEYRKTKLLPIILGSIVLVLAAIELRRELLADDKPATLPEEKEVQRGDTLHRYWFTAAWMGGFLLAVYLFGVMAATPLFIVFYLKCHGRRWLTTIMLAAGTTAFIYVIFIWLLREELHKGLLFEFK